MKPVTIGLVGPCTSGKSTIRPLLEAEGYAVRHIAQEHSYVPAMWQLIAKPDVLVFLDVSYLETLRRRNWTWTEAEYAEQQRRLAHAREHADLLIDTDGLSPEEIAEGIVGMVENKKIQDTDRTGKA
jgi:guanylate kinase